MSSPIPGVGGRDTTWSETTPAMYLDQYGFIIGPNDEPPKQPSLRETEREHKKIDKWMKMIGKWDCTTQHYKKLKRRVRKGIPETLRGLSWQLLLGSRELQLNNEGLYATLSKQEMNPTQSEIAKRDLSRTFPTHALFLNADGVGQPSLFTVLHAYAVYDPLVGYCQGMGFIVATLLTQMSEEEAFWAFVVLMRDKKYNIGEMYLPEFPRVKECFGLLELLIKKHIPELATHLIDEGVVVMSFASQWFMTLFVYVFPFKLVLRVWDIFLTERWKIIFRIAIYLLLSESSLLLTLNMEGILQKLKTLHNNKTPDDIITEANKLKITNRELELLTISLREEGL